MDEYWRGRDSSSYYDEQTNSFDDFVENYFEINKPSYEEYCKIKETGIRPEVDYKTEFKKYLERRGCANESELQALNQTHHFTVDGLKEHTKTTLICQFFTLIDNGVCDISIMDNIDYIINNGTLKNFVDYLNHPYNGPCSGTTALKELIAKLPEDLTGEFNLDGLNEAIDKMIEIIKEKDKNRNQAQYEIWQKEVFANKPTLSSATKTQNIRHVEAYAIAG